MCGGRVATGWFLWAAVCLQRVCGEIVGFVDDMLTAAMAAMSVDIASLFQKYAAKIRRRRPDKK